MLAFVNTPSAPLPVELREVAEPQPAADEALVEVHAFSLNRGELFLLAMRPEGWRLGQDVAGVVVQAAADGSGPKEGTRVVALVDGGGWAQRVAAPTARMAALPDNVSFASAATLPVSGLTALRTVRLGGALLGRRVLITGAAGGVGSFAVQLAALAGAEVIGVVGRPERATHLTERGATATVTSIQEAEGLFDLILESAGGSSLAGAISKVAPQGTIVMFGNSSIQETPFNLANFVGHAEARLIAFFIYESGSPASMGVDLATLVSLVASGKLTPEIGLADSWHNLSRAVTALRDRNVNGKAVLHID
jgi:NADPH2:quinone reductase